MKLQKTTKLTNINLLSKIIFLNFKYLQNEKGFLFSQENIVNLLNSSNVIAWFLLDNNNDICGYLIGKSQRMNDGRYVFFINYFYLTENYRNMGYDKRMLLTCFKEIKDINIKFILVISEKNTSEYELYKSLGFSLDPLCTINNEKYEMLYVYR